MPVNPKGFPERLRYLMDGAGVNSRELAARTGGKVSHMTIEYWLKDAKRAGDGVDDVAAVFGWQGGELLYGHPPIDAATRIAELESALGKLQRYLAAALGSAAAALGRTEPPKTSIIRETETEHEMTPSRPTTSKRAALGGSSRKDK